MKYAIFASFALLTAAVLPAQETTNRPPHRTAPWTDEQKVQLAQRADEAWQQLPPDAKIRILNLHKALTGMPPEERRFIHERIERFLNMAPEERAHLKKNSDRWHAMSPEERERAREQFRQWRKDHPGALPVPLAVQTNQQQSATQPKETQ